MPLQQPIRATRLEDRPDEHFMGIPNRDLTEHDWDLLTDEQRSLVESSGLWKLKTDDQMAPAIARVERAAEKATLTTLAAADKAAEQPSATDTPKDGGSQ